VHRVAVGREAVPVAELEPLGGQLMAALDAPGPFGNRSVTWSKTLRI